MAAYKQAQKEKRNRRRSDPEKRAADAARIAANHRRRSSDENYTRARRNARLKHDYGITIERYEELMQAVNCAICHVEFRGDPKEKVLDHNHDTSTVREVLCQKCNKGLGLFLDNPRIIRSAASYLEKHNG
jgi:hypothetical protein